MEKLTIFHTNDMHSHLTYWPRIARELSNQRKRSEETGESVLIFDSGDAGDRIHSLTEATNGLFISSLLNEASYDAVTIGNNEGIGNTKKELNRLYDEADYSVIVSNIKDKQTNKRPHWADEFKCYTTNKGYKIGVIACTIPLPTSYDLLGWHIEEPVVAIKRLINRYRESVDMFILLSHLGLQTDVTIAECFPEIAVILGGHTHHLLPEGERVNQTLVAGAGKFGRHIGKVVTTIEGSYHFSSTATVYDAKRDLPPVLHEEETINRYAEAGQCLLEEEIICELDYPLTIDWDKETNIVTTTLKAIKEETKDDIAILNAGLFLKPLRRGRVSKKDVHECLPHPMRLLTVSLKGRDLIQLIESMEYQRERLRSLPVAGFGFRGKVFGDICYNGIDLSKDGILINGLPVNSKQTYTVTTVDYFLYVPFFPVIAQKGKNTLRSSKFLRTIMGDYLKETYPVSK